jgi:hypothetical protein
MAARLAPKVRVPATMGRRCTADMVGRREEKVDTRSRMTRSRRKLEHSVWY